MLDPPRSGSACGSRPAATLTREPRQVQTYLDPPPALHLQALVLDDDKWGDA